MIRRAAHVRRVAVHPDGLGAEPQAGQLNATAKYQCWSAREYLRWDLCAAAEIVSGGGQAPVPDSGSRLASRPGGAEGGNGRDEVEHVLGLEMLVERGGAGVALVAGEAPWPVAGLVGGEGAARLAADLAGEFGDLLDELPGQARPGIEDGDHRPRAVVVPVDL